MAKGGGRRSYVRDANGRFASTPGGGGPKRPATKAVKRGPNRLTRDNAGKITSQGGDGATVRGGRLKTAAGNLRGRQVAKLKTMQGVSYGKPKAKKQLQSPEARKERVDLAKDRAKEAKFLKSLPKDTRRAQRLADKSMYNSLANGGKGASARMHINEGMTILRANFNKRKGLSPGQLASMNKSIQYSAKKLGVVLANPKPGRRLTAETLRKYAQPNKAISKAKPPSTVAKPKGLKAKPASKSSPLASAAATLRQSLSKAKTRPDEAKARLAYKRVVRQELKNNPQNVLASNAPKQKRLPNQDSRMSKSKVKTVGNSKEQVQKRVGRKLYQAERAVDRTLETRSKGLLVQDSIYQKQLKTSQTLKQASKFIKTGEMPKGDNSIAEKRKIADTRKRLIQKNKQRARERALGLPSLPYGARRK